METKQVREFDIEYYLNWEYDITIENLEKDLIELKKLGATNIQISSETQYDMAITTIKAICKREETVEEYQERIEIVNKRNLAQKEWDMKMLNQLKEKYNL